MSLIKYIWNALFGKVSKKENFDRAGSIDEPKLKVIYKKDDSSAPQDGDCLFINPETEIGRTYTENELGNPEPSLRDDINRLTTPDVSSKTETPKTKKRAYEKKSAKEKKLYQYLIKYGSIDKETSKLIFGIKRLDCMILSLRKKGITIQSKFILLSDENGEKRKVNNYVLVNSDGTN
jgi:hypothetical protein